VEIVGLGEASRGPVAPQSPQPPVEGRVLAHRVALEARGPMRKREAIHPFRESFRI
jgi:hypothetical protein